jgi:hypothetical protein
MSAQLDECSRTVFILSGMSAITISNDQIGTSSGLLVPSEEVAELTLTGALLGVVEVDTDHGTAVPDAQVKPNLQEPTLLLSRDG